MSSFGTDSENEVRGPVLGVVDKFAEYAVGFFTDKAAKDLSHAEDPQGDQSGKEGTKSSESGGNTENGEE